MSIFSWALTIIGLQIPVASQATGGQFFVESAKVYVWFLQASLEVLLLRVWAYGLYRRFTAAHRAEVSAKALFRFKVFVGVLAA